MTGDFRVILLGIGVRMSIPSRLGPCVANQGEMP
jgi:hypothetical protein